MYKVWSLALFAEVFSKKNKIFIFKKTIAKDRIYISLVTPVILCTFVKKIK